MGWHSLVIQSMTTDPQPSFCCRRYLHSPENDGKAQLCLVYIRRPTLDPLSAAEEKQKIPAFSIHPRTMRRYRQVPDLGCVLLLPATVFAKTTRSTLADASAADSDA